VKRTALIAVLVVVLVAVVYLGVSVASTTDAPPGTEASKPPPLAPNGTYQPPVSGTIDGVELTRAGYWRPDDWGRLGDQPVDTSNLTVSPRKIDLSGIRRL
jgi:hypothetical protein